MVDLTNPIFHCENKAREHLEKLTWPHGPTCPHCKATGDAIAKVHRKIRKPRKADPNKKWRPQRQGLYYCNDCKATFTVTVGTVMERSRIPLTKWVAAFHFMAAAKKGVSSHQLGRQLGLSYKTAHFLSMRVREAMNLPPETDEGPLGGEGKIIESDETFVGGKKKNVHVGKPAPKKHPVHALVERGGKLRAKHVPDVTAKTLRDAIVTQASRKSELHTDDALAYYWLGREFKRHRAVNHTAKQYVTKDGQAHVNTAESFFAILKRQIYGSHHSVSEAHLFRYVNEAMFRWNHRIAMGYDDAARAAVAIKGARGKRLTYRRIDEAPNS